MYTLNITKNYLKDLKKIKRNSFGNKTQAALQEVLSSLNIHHKVPSTYHDHRIIEGVGKNDPEKRECHIRGNLILVYTINTLSATVSLLELTTHGAMGWHGKH